MIISIDAEKMWQHSKPTNDLEKQTSKTLI